MKYSVLLVALFTSTIVAKADNWCLPYNDCMADVSPIHGNTFDTCEERCTMRDPVPVRGLNAKLYDVSCIGDSSSSEYRMMLGEYKDWEGNHKAYIVTPEGTEELVRCPL